ncbi:hypothetical protein [Streptomyces sp. NPDC058307]|uniref:hypothetical protein n=1 Tax=Streptomyces sp. NPDC058307 TaxID=3346439 RepID=UPI0036E4E373
MSYSTTGIDLTAAAILVALALTVSWRPRCRCRRGTRVTGLPYAALLVPLAVYAACLLAAATSLPLLRRSLRPGELRYT